MEEKTMITKRIVTLLVGGAMILSTPLISLGQGKGGGGGGSGGGNAGTAAGALYGDLYVIERDGNGEPVLATINATGGPYTCQQPLAAGCSLLPLNGTKPDFNPELEDACAVQATSADLLQAVTFGRESVSRAPATVIDKSYAEALKLINLATPQCAGDTRAIKLDSAGRITLCTLDAVTGNYAWAAIDSPLENLGLYRAAMTSGCFGPISEESVGEEGVPITVITELSVAAKGYLVASGLGHVVCGSTVGTVEKADMLSAAAFIAAGADKFTPVTLDQIINVNNYLGVNKYTYTTSRKVKTLNITYFQFKVAGGPGGWFGYTKGVDACVTNSSDNTVSLLKHQGGNEFTIDNVIVFGVSPPGVALTDVTVCRGGVPLSVSSVPVVCDNAALNPVYSSTDIYGCGGANWFTQAAEHARKTIWYLHNFEPPVIAY
jgi:hypothetical protein